MTTTTAPTSKAKPPTIAELRQMTDEDLARFRTELSHTVATINADLHAHELGGTHERTPGWLRSATYARDKYRATLAAVIDILAERATATTAADDELLAAAEALIASDIAPDASAFDRAWDRLEAATTTARARRDGSPT